MTKIGPHQIEAGSDGQVLTTVAGAPAWADSIGGGGPKIAAFKYTGDLAVGVGATRLYNDTGADWTIASVRASVESAPAGGTVVVDVNIDDTTIFTTQANRPAIASATLTSGKVTSMDITTVPDGSYLTVDVDTTTAPAANLTVIVVLS